MYLFRQIALLAGASALIGFGLTAKGQDNNRYSIAGVQAAMAKRAALEQAPYLTRLGDLRLNLGASVGVEYNDNINLVQSHGQQDLILRPGMQMSAFLPITALNSANFSLGVSPAIYVSHSAYDQMVITPGSELGFDFYIRDWLVNVHDRFSYQQDPVSVGSVSGTAVFGGFNNSLGLQGIWDLNQLQLVFGYDRDLFISSTSLFSYLNRQGDSFNARANLLINDSATVGVYSSLYNTSYDQKLLNDNLAVQAGMDAAFQVSAHLKLSGGLGLVSYFFRNTSTLGPTPNQNGYSVHLELAHDLNEKVSYSLRAERTLQMGVGADLLELTSVHLQLPVKLIRNLATEFNAFYEDGHEIGAGTPEKFQRYGVGAVIGWQATKHARTQLRYAYTLKDSDTAGRGYQQNSILLEFLYQF